jgi:threonine dehydrogenase-like Zn-dependent dehydrogenase
VIRLLESGKVNIDPWVTHRVAFEQVIGGFDQWLNPNTKFIKALVEV